MKKYQIAFAGTFDVENYGDLMFPIIFDKAMKKRGVDLELTLFSPTDISTKALDKSQILYSFKDFDELNNKKHFDALVIGGGAIIHYKDFETLLPEKNKREVYHNIHSWLTLILLAVRNNIKIVFNLPQAPFKIPEELYSLSKAIFDQVDYLSVRDAFSKTVINDVYKENKKPNIYVYPDTLSIINELFSVKELKERRKRLLKSKKKYMVLHFQYVNDMSDILYKRIYGAMEDALNRGLEVVLLPLGYTHNDKATLEKFNKKSGNKCVVFDQKLDIIDMTAILAGSEYYLGSSFHGAVVSLAFGCKAFSVNPSIKNQEMFKFCGLEKFLAWDYLDIRYIIDEVFSGNIEYNYPKKNISRLVNEHFDNIERELKSKQKKKDFNTLINEIILVIPKFQELIERYTQIQKITKENDIKLTNELKKRDEDLRLIRNSNAFKLGNKVTWLPSKIKTIVKKSCIKYNKENGA